MRGPDDHLLETPDRDLLREVTGLEPAEPGTHAILPDARNRTTQRVGLSDVGGGIIVFTWPGELMEQAQRLYDGERAPRVLAAAYERAWKVELRPHLAYFHSKPWERLYMHPRPTMTAEQYVVRWAGADAEKIGGHHPETIRDELWPWLLKRGYATDRDVELLEPFLDRVEDANRDVHLRPGLALIRRWQREEAADKRRRGHLADEIRGAESGPRRSGRPAATNGASVEGAPAQPVRCRASTPARDTGEAVRLAVSAGGRATPPTCPAEA